MNALKRAMGVVIAMVAFATAAHGAITEQDRQQAACFDDVQRLCGNDIPDVDRVKACMTSKLRQVSPACAKFYKTKPTR